MQHLFPSHSQWWLSSHTIRIFLVNCFRNTQQRKTKLIYSHQGVLFNFHCGGGVISLISYTYCFNNEVTKLRTPHLIISGATVYWLLSVCPRRGWDFNQMLQREGIEKVNLRPQSNLQFEWPSEWSERDYIILLFIQEIQIRLRDETRMSKSRYAARGHNLSVSLLRPFVNELISYLLSNLICPNLLLVFLYDGRGAISWNGWWSGQCH